jgi:hypothetical protein
MNEKFPSNAPIPFPKGSPQEKLETLLKSLQNLKNESRDGISLEIREAGILANEQEIKKLKARHPELNN